MKHKEYLANLSNAEIIRMIEDYGDLHYASGQLPNDSKIRELTKIVCDDFSIPYNLFTGEKVFLEEVLDRYYAIYKYLSFMKQK